MNLVREMLDRVILVGGVLAAGCVPSYIAQYRPRVGGMLDQAVKDLGLFQQIANRNHGGDLNRLIKHHLASTDPTFREEGKAIQTMVETVARLRESLAALNADLFGQVKWMVTSADTAVAKATWDAFVPAMSLTSEALIFAFATGVAIWLVFLAVWFGTARFMDVILARGRPGKWSAPKSSKAK